MNDSDGEKRGDAGGAPCPAHDQAAVLPLDPGQRPLGLEARALLAARSPPRLAGLPPPCGKLGAEPTLTAATAAVLGLLALIRRQDLAPCARSAPVAGADGEGLQPRDDLGPLVTMGGRRARGQRHAGPVRETMAEEALAFAAQGDALPPACAGGNRRHPRRRMATASAPVPRPGARWPASAAAPEAPHAWTPMAPRGA